MRRQDHSGAGRAAAGRSDRRTLASAGDRANGRSDPRSDADLRGVLALGGMGPGARWFAVSIATLRSPTRSWVSRTEMVATPLTRPPGSESTTRPSTWEPRGATTLPSIMMGSARVAVNVSPVCALLVESVVSVRILMGVPALMVTDGGFRDSGKSAFAGAASESGVEPVVVAD